MKKIDRLITEAKESCKLRGHSMLPFHHYEEGLAYSECTRCQRATWINANPMPNQIEIAGGAVARHC